MRFAVLGSGSKGNCLVVDGGGVVVMIDAGFAPRECRQRMRSLDIDLRDLSALFITHGHGDHVKGARQIAGSRGIRTYASERTHRFTSTHTRLSNHTPLEPGDRVKIGGLTVTPTKTPHDEPGSVCYVVDDGDEAFAIVTDLGFACPKVGAALHGVDTLMVEMNHDLHMLQTGPYSAHLKRRIASKYGHVSNDDGAALLQMAVSTSLSRVLCAHLSEVNNTPEKALRAARAIVDGKDVEVAVAPQHAPTTWLRVRRRPATRTRRSLDLPALVPDVVDVVAVPVAALPEMRIIPPPPPLSLRGSAHHPIVPGLPAPGPGRPATSEGVRVGAGPSGARPISYNHQLALFSSRPTTTTTTIKERS